MYKSPKKKGPPPEKALLREAWHEVMSAVVADEGGGCKKLKSTLLPGVGGQLGARCGPGGLGLE